MRIVIGAFAVLAIIAVGQFGITQAKSDKSNPSELTQNQSPESSENQRILTSAIQTENAAAGRVSFDEETDCDD